MPISVSCANVSYIYKDHCLVVVSLKMFFFFFIGAYFLSIPLLCFYVLYVYHLYATHWNMLHTILQIVMFREVKEIVVSGSFGMFEAWLSPCVFAGGRSHRDWSETANTGHVSFLQQAQEQVLLSLGSRHYLKEKNESPPQHQPGPWGFTVIFKFQEDQYNCLSYTKIYLLFPWAFILHCSAWVMTTWPPFCPNRSLLMVKSQWKSLQMAYMSILPRNTQ